MAVKTFTTMVQTENFIQSACTKAVEKASSRICDQLHYFIWDDYYALYDPIAYSRSYSFLESAMTRMLSPNSADIYMNADNMKYGDYWDGETQLYMADAGFHGNVGIWREGFFWKDFEKWCNENAIRILREELANQGIKTV